MTSRKIAARIGRLEERAARLTEARRWARVCAPAYTGAQLRILDSVTAYLVGNYPYYPSQRVWDFLELPSHERAAFWRAAWNEFDEWLSREYPHRAFSEREIARYAPLIRDFASVIFDEVTSSAVPLARRRYFFHPRSWSIVTPDKQGADEGIPKPVRILRLIRCPAPRLLREARALAHAWSQLPPRLRKIEVDESARLRTPLQHVARLNGLWE